MIQKEMTEKEALAKLTALCARGEHSQGEMLDKMHRWGLDDETAKARVMAYLVEHKYVDDERFTRAFVHDKIAYNQWGRRKIEQALWTKGIDKATQAKILDEIDDSEYLSALKPLLQAKQRSVKAASDYELRGKLIRFAMQRGFTFDIINQCIDGAEDYEDNINEAG
ncbi:MAG: RecX family transcriptional regulator [Prevotella sp.]|nr:RecX family transcriptional regulator [Prevotella sp.]